MTPIIAWQIIIMLIVLGSCFFFAMSEASLVAANENLLKKLASSGDKRAAAAFKLITNREILFGIVLLGTNIAIVTFTTLGESLLGNQDDNVLMLILSILVWDGIILIFGEIMPKSLALEAPDKNSVLLAPTLSFLAGVFKPLINAVHYIPSLFLKGANPDDIKNRLVTGNQIRLALIEGSQSGVVDVEQKDFGMKVMDFAETTVDRVMTLRGDIISLPAETTIHEAYDKIREHGYSRIPIYTGDDEESIVGFINVKDLIKAYISESQNKPLGELKREMLFVPYKKKVIDMLMDFQREHTHIAMVVDEAGNINGLVTLEDLLEEVVGEIYDEHDEPEDIIQKLSPGTYLVDGGVEVEYINSRLDLNLDDEEYETIAGFVMGLFGKVPKEGMSKHHGDVRFTIAKMDGRQIEKIKIKFESSGSQQSGN
jgi:putative hemolysin